MKNSKVIEFKDPAPVDMLSQLIKREARRLVTEALEAEVESFLSAVEEKLSDGRRRVVRNGYLPERAIMTGIGAIVVKA